MNWGHPDRGKVLLLAGDVALAIATIWLAKLVRPGVNFDPPLKLGLLMMYVVVFIASFYVFDLYNIRTLNGIRTLTRLFIASIVATAVFLLLTYGVGWHSPSRDSLGIAVALLLLSSSAWRTAYKRHYAVLFRNRGVLFIGDLYDAALLQEILASECSSYELRGFLQLEGEGKAAGEVKRRERPRAVAAAAGDLRGAAAAVAMVEQWNSAGFPTTDRALDGRQDRGALNCEQLERATTELDVDTIVLRGNPVPRGIAETLTELRFRGIRIATMLDVCSEVLEGLPVDALSDEWLSFATGFPLLHQKAFRKVKRLSDILFAGAGLIVALPISLAAAFAIKLESSGPILFRQWRVGWKEKPFLLLKFRSMLENAEPDGTPQWAAAKDPRITRVGAILRTLHIDEIPQMINVLRGEMSFIGPRPERPQFVDLLKTQIPFYSLRHYVPPGITGWAQVNYPYGATVEDARRKLEFDLFYAQNASPTLDLRILLRTIRVVIFRAGSR